jgi:hypothetical protein
MLLNMSRYCPGSGIGADKVCSIARDAPGVLVEAIASKVWAKSATALP